MNVDDIDDIDDLNDELDINVDSLSLASKKKEESKDKIKLDEISKEKKDNEEEDLMKATSNHRSRVFIKRIKNKSQRLKSFQRRKRKKKKKQKMNQLMIVS